MAKARYFKYQKTSGLQKSASVYSFHALLKNAGIDGEYGIHALRHTFASMLFAKGVDVKIVSKLLGHSTVKITYDIYVHLFEKDISHVTSVLD